MNDVEQAEYAMLMAAFIEAHRPERRYISRQVLASDYHSDVDTRLFNSIAVKLRELRLVKAAPAGGSYGILLAPNAYNDVLSRILYALGATYFRVSWSAERIITDANEERLEAIAHVPEGWMVIRPTDEPDRSAGEPAAAPSAAPQRAGRDINHFYGPVYGTGTSTQTQPPSDKWWPRWGTIFGGVGVLVAVITGLATWYFWAHPK